MKFFYASFWLLALSGLAWLASVYVIEGHEGWGNVALNTQFWAMKIHGAGMMLFMLGLGASFTELVDGMRERNQKSLRFALAALIGLLILSGWLLFYGPSGGPRDWVSKEHWSLGLLASSVIGAWLLLRPKKAPDKRSRKR